MSSFIERKRNFIEEQSSEGMPFKELCVSGVNLRFENSSERM